MKRVDGKPHFLCGKCAKGRSTTSWIAALIGVTIVLGAAWWLKPSGSPPGERIEKNDWFTHADFLLRSGKYAEARAGLEAKAKETPEDARVHFLLGQCLLAMGAAEGAHAAFITAAAAEKDAEETEDSITLPASDPLNLSGRLGKSERIPAAPRTFIQLNSGKIQPAATSPLQTQPSARATALSFDLDAAYE